MYEKAEEDAIESQLKERANHFAQELVKVSTIRFETFLEIPRERHSKSSDGLDL